MRMDVIESAERTEEFVFDGAWIKNADKITARKSIVICGISRGGTSFAASVFGQLGVPYSRSGERDIGRRYEHRQLRAAFAAKDGPLINQIATEFGNEHKVWAWKLPAIQKDFSFAAEQVPNPHFVIIFKEPLSVAARKTDLKGKETIRSLNQVLTVYQQLASIALETTHPLMLISYDRAMSRLKPFLSEAARFAGVRNYDPAAVIAGIREDGARYFRSEESPNSEKAGPGDAAPMNPARQAKLKKAALRQAAKKEESYL